VGIDWLRASHDERKALYRAVRAMMREEALSWDAVFSAALPRIVLGARYEDNFRAGRNSRIHCNQIYRWLLAQYPAHAMRLDDELGAARAEHGAGWRDWLAAHGRYKGVSAFLAPEPPIGLVRIAAPEPLARPIVPLGGGFYFQIEAPFAGKVIAFQSLGQDWYALPLRDGGMDEEISKDLNILPQGSGSDQAIPFTDDQHEGRHGFAFLLGSGALIERIAELAANHDGALDGATLDGIAASVMDSAAPWALRRINLLFVK